MKWHFFSDKNVSMFNINHYQDIYLKYMKVNIGSKFQVSQFLNHFGIHCIILILVYVYEFIQVNKLYSHSE